MTMKRGQAMPSMPAMPGTIAFTPGMKRPMKMLLPPCRAKNRSPASICGR